MRSRYLRGTLERQTRSDVLFFFVPSGRGDTDRQKFATSNDRIWRYGDLATPIYIGRTIERENVRPRIQIRYAHALVLSFFLCRVNSAFRGPSESLVGIILKDALSLSLLTKFARSSIYIDISNALFSNTLGLRLDLLRLESERIEKRKENV